MLRLIRNVKRGLEARSRIISLLKGRALTARQLCLEAGLSYSSVMLQLRNLEREGVVERLGKPPFTWRLTGRGQCSIDEFIPPSSLSS